MPVYAYRCYSCEYELRDLVDSMDLHNRLVGSECPECGEKDLKRIIGSNTGISFKGWWPDQRRKKVKARKARQAARIEHKIDQGEMTQQEADQMARIRNKYAKTSPYLTDPEETKSRNSKKYTNTIKYNSSDPLPEPKIDGFDSKKPKKKE